MKINNELLDLKKENKELIEKGENLLKLLKVSVEGKKFLDIHEGYELQKLIDNIKKKRTSLRFNFGEKVIYDKQEVIVLGIRYDEKNKKYEYSIRNMRAMSGVIIVSGKELEKIKKVTEIENN